MAKAFFLRPAMVFLFCLGALSCSKPNQETSTGGQTPIPDSFPIANSKLKNCRFEVENPTYTYGSAITPNRILCDEGVARAVSLLSQTPLPAGLSFSQAELALVGTASEKVTAAAYQFYIENEAGYLILKMRITVK
ncbi:MAG: hypothetical protein KGP28_05940 [Bdellovibrionales bacterium]|nr:hypothetical protein [Bdellovibrionales bacterium]